MPADVIIDTYEETIKLDIHEVTRRLIEHLGPTMVAALAGAKDRKLPHRWAKADGVTPRDESVTRLQFAHRVWMLLASAESEHVARAWFVGVNPRLGETQPFMAMRESRFVEVMAAARAFIDGTDE